MVEDWSPARPTGKGIRNAGLTLLDVLVVLCLMSLMLTIAVPAIEASRSTSLKFTCAKNLQSVGVALSNYHSQFSKFPPCAVWGGPPGEPQGMGHFPIGTIDRVAIGTVTSDDPDRIFANWLVLLLPALNQGNAWNSFDPTLPISSPTNETVRMLKLPFLRCPTDTFNGQPYLRGETVPSSKNVYSRGNYAMNFGPGKFCLYETNPSCDSGFHVDNPQLLTQNSAFWGSGAGGFNRSFCLNDIGIGVSNFVIVDEIRAGVHSKDSRGTWALGYIGSSLTARHGGQSEREDACGPNNQHRNSDDVTGCVQVTQLLGRDEIARLRMPCWVKGANAEPEVSLQATARSMHPSGVHVLTADGVVRFISDNIHAPLWYSIHSRQLTEEFDPPF